MSDTTRKPYPSDLTDAQWEIIATLIPPKVGPGEDRKVDLREVVNGILYLLRTGCQWAYLPHDFLPPGTTYYYFAKWKKDGTWDMILASLHQKVREAADREATPSAVSVDSPQSTKTTEMGGEHGYDGNKKINGRKRHIVVDVMARKELLYGGSAYHLGQH